MLTFFKKNYTFICYKEDDKKDNLECILYIQCQHYFINIVQV